MQIGSTVVDEVEIDLKNAEQADINKYYRQNFIGIQLTLQQQAKHLETLQSQYEVLVNAYQTLQNEVVVMKSQHAMHLQKLLNGGPTGDE